MTLRGNRIEEFGGSEGGDEKAGQLAVGKAGYVPLPNLSAGQRCVAVFPLLLRNAKAPLVIDQPEDNLDNRYIADTVAPDLLRRKSHQQFLVTSHNANLVVLTDADLVVHVDSDGKTCKFPTSGFLACPASRIKQAVLDVLDGGEAALAARQRKYSARRSVGRPDRGREADASADVWPEPREPHRTGKVYNPSLDGYGAEHDFYGDPALDKLITDVESKVFTTFITECRAGEDRAIDSDSAATFAVQVFARCKSYRSMMADSLERMMVEASATLRTVDFQKRMLVRAVREHPLFIAEALRFPGSFDEFVRKRVEQNQAATSAILNRTQVEARAAVAEFQNRAIKERLDFSGSRREALRLLHWRRISVSTGEFVLGDSVVACELADGSFKPVHEPDDDLRRVWLPIGAQQVLVGSAAEEFSAIDVAKVNHGSASCSYDSFCGHSGPDDHRALIKFIRTRTFSMTPEQITTTVARALQSLV